MDTFFQNKKSERIVFDVSTTANKMLLIKIFFYFAKG